MDDGILYIALSKEVKGARMPKRGSKGAAGLDLYSPQDFVLPPGQSIKINTGVHVELPEGTYGRVADRSSHMVKDIRTSGVIDPDYRGPIKVYLFNHGDDYLEVREGDGIAQLIVEKYATPDIRLVQISDLTVTERGNAGFGSTNPSKDKESKDDCSFFY